MDKDSRWTPDKVFGLMAEYDSPEKLKHAAEKVRQMGFTHLDAYSPLPVDGLDDLIVERKTRLPLVVLISGLSGAMSGFLMMTYLNAINYPINVGGRPLFSWQSFMPITFELGVLFAAIGAVLGFLMASRLPQIYHPVFNVPGFAQASTDRFFLCIMSEDPKYHPDRTRETFKNLDPQAITITEVPY